MGVLMKTLVWTTHTIASLLSYLRHLGLVKVLVGGSGSGRLVQSLAGTRLQTRRVGCTATPCHWTSLSSGAKMLSGKSSPMRCWRSLLLLQTSSMVGMDQV